MSCASDLARGLGAHAEAVCRHYLPSGRREGRYWICGDVMGTPGRSLYVRLFGPRAGKWTDAADGTHGDLLDLIALNRGLDFRAALDEARAFLSLPMPPIRQAEPPARAWFIGSGKTSVRRIEARSRHTGGKLVPPARHCSACGRIRLALPPAMLLSRGRRDAKHGPRSLPR